MGWPEAIKLAAIALMTAFEFFSGISAPTDGLRGFGNQLELQHVASEVRGMTLVECFRLDKFPESARAGLAGAFGVTGAAITKGETYCLPPAVSERDDT